MSRTHIFRLQFLLAASDALPLELLVDFEKLLLILETKLFVDDVQISDGIDLTFNVSDLLVLKSTWEERNLLVKYL